MRQAIARLLIDSTSATRCLMAIGGVLPFLLCYFGMHAHGMSRPDIAAGLRMDVMWAAQALLSVAICILMSTALWLWPQRRAMRARPGTEFLVALVIGLVYTAIPILVGSFSAGPTLALLGASVMGLLLFQWEIMLAVILLCGGLLMAYNILMVGGSLPYAPAITALAFEHGEPRDWWATWQGVVLYLGMVTVVAILMMLFASHDAMHRRLRHLSSTDGMTGLANRRHFMARLQAELARQQRNGQPLTVLLIDADHFKHINDRHGHAKGDEVLVKLAEVLATGVRTPSDLAARLGGEEFALLLPNTAMAEAEVVYRRLQASLANCRFQSRDDNEASFGLTVSMGAVQGLGVPAQQLLRQVDDNLYRAKAAGRNRTECSIMDRPASTGVPA